MSELLFLGFWFTVMPLVLHELGHWLFIKFYKIPYKFFFFKKKTLVFGFVIPFSHLNYKKTQNIGLGGAFPPLLLLVVPIIWGDVLFFVVGFFDCLLLAFWSILEARKNMHAYTLKYEID